MKKYVAPEADFIEFDGQMVIRSSTCQHICLDYTCDYDCEGTYGSGCTGGHNLNN